MDFGHDVEFGTFINPASAAPHEPVELALLSERLGFDMVTFQDHPYHPTMLDTWTLLSYVAARTDRIRISPNVLNLPLRPPAVVARAAASLDLLSGGRCELAMGAGFFWDEIEAMGGGRLTPGQGVEALGEAISIIRQVWDVNAPGRVRVSGLHYQVDGARRGPQPSHQIPILVGAHKPRMLALAGRLADGWIPSQPGLHPMPVHDATQLVDRAAMAAGRPSGDIRRYFNILPPEDRSAHHWAEELASLAVEEGFSVFILVSDDPAVMERFASEVAPAVRELVARSRAGAT